MKLFILLLVALSVSACAPKNSTTTNSAGDVVADVTPITKFGAVSYKRANIDGVDCVIGTSNSTSTAVSCDWLNKKWK